MNTVGIRPGSLSAASAQRRYIGLTALRWLPLGLSVPVTVLLASSRGLGAAEIGLVFAAHSVMALVLELPTGGLADAIGRRPVLVLSALFHIAGLLVLAAARDLPGFLAAFAFVGVGRALDSGPLESWYVDAVHQLDPHADTTRGLSRAGIANGAGLAFGAAAGGLVPALSTAAGNQTDTLVLPVLIAAGLDAVYLACVVVLVTPLGPSRDVAAMATVRNGVREVPAIVRGTVRLAGRDPALRVLLVVAFLVGVVLFTLELIGPLRFADLAGDRTEATAVFGIVMAVSFTAAAAGSALATTARRAASGSIPRATAVLFALCALAVIGIAVAPTVIGAGVAYAAFYLANGAGWPLRQQVMHSRVDASSRATAVSAMSFALMLGGITGSLVVPRLAEATTLPVAFGAAAFLLLLAGAASLRLPVAAGRPQALAQPL